MVNSSDNDEVVTQDKDNRASRPVVPLLASSSSSIDDEDKGIVNCIDAIKKGRRLSAFCMAPDVEKK